MTPPPLVASSVAAAVVTAELSVRLRCVATAGDPAQAGVYRFIR